MGLASSHVSFGICLSCRRSSCPSSAITTTVFVLSVCPDGRSRYAANPDMTEEVVLIKAARFERA